MLRSSSRTGTAGEICRSSPAIFTPSMAMSGTDTTHAGELAPAAAVLAGGAGPAPCGAGGAAAAGAGAGAGATAVGTAAVGAALASLPAGPATAEFEVAGVGPTNSKKLTAAPPAPGTQARRSAPARRTDPTSTVRLATSARVSCTSRRVNLM